MSDDEGVLSRMKKDACKRERVGERGEVRGAGEPRLWGAL